MIKKDKDNIKQGANMIGKGITGIFAKFVLAPYLVAELVHGGMSGNFLLAKPFNSFAQDEYNAIAQTHTGRNLQDYYKDTGEFIGGFFNQDTPAPENH